MKHNPGIDSIHLKGEVNSPKENRSSDRRKDVYALCFLAAFIFFKFRAFLLPGGTLYWAGDFIELAPQRAFFYQNLRRGTLILWDGFIGAGMPYLAEDFGVFYPLDLLTGILIPNFFNPLVLSWVHAFQFWLGGVFTYLYVRQLGLSRVPSLVSALCFISGGFLAGHASQRNIVETVTWLPLILYFLDKALLQRRALWASLAGLFLAFSFLAGHPQFFYFILLYLAGYYLFNLYRRFRARAWKDLAGDAWYFGVCGLFCLGISAIQLWPLLSTSLITYHGTRPFEWNALLPFNLFNLVHFLIPGYTTWTAADVDEAFSYIGLFPLLLALWAVIQSKDKRIVFLSLIALFSFIASLGDTTPLYKLLYHYLPGLNQFRIPARFNLLISFPLAVLAGFGVHRFLEEPGPGTPPGSLKPLTRILWLALAGGFLCLVLVGFSLPDQVTGKAFGGWWKVLRKNFFWFLLFWCASYLLVLFRCRYYSLTWIRKGGLILLVSVDLLLLAWVEGGYTPKDPTRSDVPQAQTIVSQLKQDHSLYRVDNRDRWLSSFLCYKEGINPYDLENLLGYVSTVLPKEYLEILFRVDQNPLLLDLLNVKYFVGTSPHPPGKMIIKIGGKLGDREFDLPRPIPVSQLTIQSFLAHSVSLPQGQTVAWVELEKPDGSSRRIPLRAGLETAEWAIDHPGLNGAHQKARVVDSWDMPGEGYQGHAYEFTIQLVPSVETARIRFFYVSGQGNMEIRNVLINGQTLPALLYTRFQSLNSSVYGNSSCFPRVFMISKARAIPNEPELLEQMEQLIPSKTILLSRLPEEYREPSGASFSTREATVLRYSHRYIKILTTADQNKFLVLSDTHSPFWKAEIDKHPVPVLKVNYGLRGLFVPKGEHRVEFFFRFYPFYLGLAVTLLSLSALLTWLVVAQMGKAGRGTGG